MVGVDDTQTPQHDDAAPPYVLVLLAGSLNPYALQRAIGLPALCLPVTETHTLLDVWLDAVEAAPGCRSVRIVTSSRADADAINRLVTARRTTSPNAISTMARAAHAAAHTNGRGRSHSPVAVDEQPAIEVTVDPSHWRGPAGLIRDIAAAEAVTAPTFIVAAEAACLPPASLASFVREFAACGDALVLGNGGDSRHSGQNGGRNGSAPVEPAGVYALTERAIQLIPTIGYYDLREQLLPEMYKRGMPARLARTTGERIRLHSRPQYLAAFRRMMNRHDDLTGLSEDAQISASASISGTCLIAAGAVIEDGAVIHESIVLGGARVSSGAVVSHSVIGPRAVVESCEVVRNSVRAAADLTRGPSTRVDHGRTDNGAASRLNGQHRPGVRGMFGWPSATGAAAPQRSDREGDER